MSYSPQNKCDFVLVAGGSGARFQSLKQFENLEGKAAYLWSLEKFLSWPQCGLVALVVPEEWIEKIKFDVKKYTNVQVVKGGSSRQASATAGFQFLSSESSWVMVHDAARPCVTLEFIDRIWTAKDGPRSGRELGGVIPGLPVRETIKEVQKINDRVMVRGTPKRETLYTIQTPQLFSKKILKAAYEKFSENDAADDSTLVEKLGYEVIVVPGEYDNLKITFREDLERVSSWLRK